MADRLLKNQPHLWFLHSTEKIQRTKVNTKKTLTQFLNKMQNNVKRETCDSDEREKVVDKKFLVREPRL